MWSGPRNISTALMRSFENRSDSFVTDEPFYAHFLYKTKYNHPMRKRIINSNEINYNKIVEYLTGKIPQSKIIWYQKHMAHHLLPKSDMSWIKSMQNCLLIRHPRDVICSYLKKYEIGNIKQLGYPQQIELFDFVRRKTEYAPIVIDADDLLKNPKKMITKLCLNLDIPFENGMLSWEPGSRRTDGVWGKHWYKQVESSTQFNTFKKNKNIIPIKYDYIYKDCMELYNHLYSNRLIVE